MKKLNKRTYTKIALALSVCLMILWAIMGTSTSLAWFTDATPRIKNTFYIGDLDMTVSYKDDTGTYVEIDPQKSVFDDEALYEPGYIQVVYMKVENNGTVPFEYKMAVDVNDVTVGYTALGTEIYLPNYLKYGVLFGADEADLDRQVAATLADRDFPDSYPLNVYSQKDSVSVPVDGERYIALIVRMPEEIGNEANYRGYIVPTVKLGITFTASQEGTL